MIVADHNTQPVTQEDRRAALVASGWYDLNPTPSVVRRPEEDIYAEWDASSPTLDLWDYVDDVGYLDYDGELLNIFSANQIIDALAMG